VRRAVLLLLLACGGGAPELAYAPVTARVPQGDRLSLAAGLPDGGPGLPDGGVQWNMGNGDVEDVLIGAQVNWLDAVGQCQSQQLGFVMPDAGITIHVFVDGGACGYEYE
jgi:hypothetical protein